MRSIVEGTAGAAGEQFSRELVRNLAAAIDVRYAFVAEFADVNTRVRTLAFWRMDRAGDDVEFDVRGTPCEDVARRYLACEQDSAGAVQDAVVKTRLHRARQALRTLLEPVLNEE